MQEALIAKGVEALAPVVFSLVSALVSWGVYELTKFFRTKTKNENVNDAISHICHTVETTVQGMEQEMVAAAKSAAADGKLTKKEAVNMKNIALTRVRSQVPYKITKIANKAINDMERFISAKIEKAVLDLKRSK